MKSFRKTVSMLTDTLTLMHENSNYKATNCNEITVNKLKGI